MQTTPAMRATFPIKLPINAILNYVYELAVSRSANEYNGREGLFG